MLRCLRAFGFVSLYLVWARLGAAVDLFDSQGKAAAYIDSASRLVRYDGEIVGFMKNSFSGPPAVYSNSGRQLGWFRSGAFHDLEGKVVLAVSGRLLVAAEFPPVKSPTKFGPVPGVPDVAAAPPVFSTEFATPKQMKPATTLSVPDVPSVFPTYVPSDEGRRAQDSIWRNIEAIAAMRERDLRVHSEFELSRQRIEDRQRQMTANAALIETNERRLRELKIEVAQSRTLQDEEIRIANAKTERAIEFSRMVKALFAEGPGPFLATRPLPELSMAKGDILRLGAPDIAGTVRISRMDSSLDPDVYAFQHGKMPDKWDSREEPLVILHACLENGGLKKLTDSEFANYLGEQRALLGSAMKLVEKLRVSTFEFRTSGERLRFDSMSQNGVVLTVNDSPKPTIIPVAVLLEMVKEKLLTEAPSP